MGEALDLAFSWTPRDTRDLVIAIVALATGLPVGVWLWHRDRRRG